MPNVQKSSDVVKVVQEEEVTVNEVKDDMTSDLSKPRTKSDAEKLVAEGKRDYVLGDFENGVDKFGEACEIFANIYGDASFHSAEALYYYGSSLLEVSRSQRGLFGEQVPNDDGADDSDEDVTVESCSGVQESGENDVEEEEYNSMEAAFEFLQLAIVAYAKYEPLTNQAHLMMAKCYEKLGEYGLEDENYGEAIKNFQQCLDIFKKIDAPKDRQAAAYYSLGVALIEVGKYKEAKDHYQTSIALIVEHIVTLKIDHESNAEAIKDMEMFVLEISHKADEAVDLIKKVLQAKDQVLRASLGESSSSNQKINITETLKGDQGESTSSGFSSENGSTSVPFSSTTLGSSSGTISTDCSHLVRKKKRASDCANSSPSTTNKNTSLNNGAGDNNGSTHKKRRVQLN